MKSFHTGVNLHSLGFADLFDLADGHLMHNRVPLLYGSGLSLVPGAIYPQSLLLHDTTRCFDLIAVL
jgi:hypothetical protein